MHYKDLMIGDWVEYRTYNNTTHKCHITLIDKGASYECCSPIPLTEEILKINGFKDYGEIKEYQFEEDGEKYKFYLKAMYNKDNVRDAWGTNIGGALPSLITYVHELQHALRLCGLEKLADDFKIN